MIKIKSYNHLYEYYLTNSNLKLAVWNATRGKTGKKKKVKQRLYYRNNYDKLEEDLLRYADSFKKYKHKEIQIYDGVRRKQRTIIVPDMKEQIVQHMAINVLTPIFMKSLYAHSYGSIPGRGSYKGKKVIEKWLRKDPKGTRYFLKMDIRKYFESVPHDILKAKLAKIIHDEKFLNLLYEIIDTTDKGIPLGFYTSQWFANFYLTELDHYITEKLGARHYIRYMDDMVVFGSSKRELHKIRNLINDFIENNLGLKMKDNWQVCRMYYANKEGKGIGRDLDFMGFRFFRDKTILRKSIMFKMTRKAKRISKKLKEKHKITIYDARQMLSYLGWIKATDTYNTYRKYIKPYISFKRLKNIIRRHDKKGREILCGEQLKTAIA